MLYFYSPSVSTRLISCYSRVLVQAYVVPVYFQDDWLNEYHDMRRGEESAGVAKPSIDAAKPISGLDSQTSRLAASDYRFVYLGPKACCYTLLWQSLFSIREMCLYYVQIVDIVVQNVTIKTRVISLLTLKHQQ